MAFPCSLGAPAPLLMTGFGLISGALSAWLGFAFAPVWLDGVGQVFLLETALVPIGVAFALAVASGLALLTRRPLVLPVVALTTMYAWSAATRTATTIITANHDELRLIVGSLAAGAVGAAGTHLGGALLIKDLRRFVPLASSAAIGAALGLIYAAAEHELVHGWQLFLVWQPAVALSLGRALVRTAVAPVSGPETARGETLATAITPPGNV